MAAPPTLFDGVDTETSLLIARLALEDIELRAQLHHGTDEAYALDVMAEDYRQFLRAYEYYQNTGQDEADTLSIGSSSAGSLLDSDDSISLDLSYVPSPSPSPHSSSSELVVATPEQTLPLTQPLVDCVACTGRITPPSAFQADCGHYFCEPCLERFLSSSTTNESLFPPWCCTPNQRIDVYQLMTVDGHTLHKSDGGPSISEDLCNRLHAKFTEHAVPLNDRVYCPNPRCSIFIGSKTALHDQGSRVLTVPPASPFSVPSTSPLSVPSIFPLSVPSIFPLSVTSTSSLLVASTSLFSVSISQPTSHYTCPSCSNSVCLTCREPVHVGECRSTSVEGFDDASMAFRDLAEQREWQSCPGCHHMVEKMSGCNHMVCRCKSEFCYRCGGKWSSSHECPRTV
ncbi:hypothetical protein L218DRAFT_700856 [Marasmius fiardii PR-910]|nr:hypothetical protein L218DRAFT_700856 [Marasmius fiardii PR-910]